MNKRINVHAIIQKGERIYSQRLKAKLEKKYFGKIVAIDPDSGDYFIGDTILEAVKKRKEEKNILGQCFIQFGPATQLLTG